MPWFRLFWGLMALTLCQLALGQRRDVTIWGANFTPDTKGFEALVREFERRNPELRVRVLSMGAGKMNPQKLMTAVVGGVAPDVVKQDRFTIGDWASRGAFLDLSKRIAVDRVKDPYCPKPEQYYSAPLSEATYSGSIFAIPEAADNRLLYWNKGLFRKHSESLRAAGLDPNRAPRTWSELEAYAKILTVRSDDGSIRQAGFLPLVGDCWFYMYAFMNNAPFLSADGRTCTIDSPEAEEALAYMVRLYDIVGGYERSKAFESGFQTGLLDPFLTEKVAMKVDGDWIIKDIAKNAPSLDFVVSPPPVPDDRFYRRGRFATEKDTFVTWSGGFSWAMPKGARNPEGGWRFIKFATSVEGRLIEARSNQDWARRRGREFIVALSGNREFNEAALKEFRPTRDRFAAALQVHSDMMSAARTRPPTFVGQLLWNEHSRATIRAVSKAASPRQALQDAQRAVQAELDNAFSNEKYPIYNEATPIYVAGAFVVCFIAFLFLSFRRSKLGAIGRNEAKWGYTFVSPWLFGFSVLTVGPMIASLLYSFTSYSVLAPARSIGLRNYDDLFNANSEIVAKAFWNAAYLAGVGVPLGIVTGLAIALLLNADVGGLRAYRTFFYMPAIVPGVASAVLWIWILAADPNKGLLNSAWSHTFSAWFQVPPPTWLNSEHWSKPALILQGVWGAGGGMMLWLAGLKGVPKSLYEAAEIDGARRTQQFWLVTAPLLSPIIFFNVVMGFINAIQEFDRVYIMKPDEGMAGPNDSMLSPVYYLFQNGFGYFKMGYASAIAWAIFAVILTLTLIQMGLRKRWVYEEVER